MSLNKSGRPKKHKEPPPLGVETQLGKKVTIVLNDQTSKEGDLMNVRRYGIFLGYDDEWCYLGNNQLEVIFSIARNSVLIIESNEPSAEH